MDDAGLHLRWATSGEQRRFAGTVSTPAPGGLRPVVGVSEAGAAAAPRIAWNPDGALSFEAIAQGRVAGLDLPAPPPDAPVTLALSLDGWPAPLHAIRLGAAGIRPLRNPFVLRTEAGEPGGADHHEHPHAHPHPPGDHHHHPHPEPHPPGLGHHHPW